MPPLSLSPCSLGPVPIFWPGGRKKESFPLLRSRADTHVPSWETPILPSRRNMYTKQAGGARLSAQAHGGLNSSRIGWSLLVDGIRFAVRQNGIVPDSLSRWSSPRIHPSTKPTVLKISDPLLS
ncbi:hypothetical protein PtB15_2B681 [Puccinia triticina]|nr:hypothetical protein PtB15_2B681 [Puccinia triticina]